MSETVLVEMYGNRGELVLNRPERRNSLTGPLVKELREGLAALVNNSECHVIVIRGAEGYFCAGLDLKEFSADPAPEWKQGFSNEWAMFHSQVYECTKPIIGALEGFAIAGGSALAFACDFLVAGKESFLHVAEAERGMPAPINIAWLQLRFGHAKAMQFALLAERFYGDELVRLGVALESIEDNHVLTRSREIADRLAGFDSDSNKRIKTAINLANGVEDFSQHIDIVRGAG